MWRWVGTGVLWLTGPVVGAILFGEIASMVSPSFGQMTMAGSAAYARVGVAAMTLVWLLTAWRISLRHHGRALRIHWIGCLAALAVPVVVFPIIVAVAHILGKA